ncbi:MAG TPA: GTPase Era [Acholeplasma sp.]|nr:GTPase Era [Acholeplasma sp.]
MTNNLKTKSGFVAIVGRPNVGKSTLLNTIIGEKVAITSNKPQTTRHRISGIYTKDNSQIVFIDTPGMHKAKDLLNKRIDKLAVSVLKEVDAILFIVDKPFGLAESHIVSYFENIKVPVFLVINKIDEINYNKVKIDEMILSYISKYNFAGVYPISAINDENINHLLNDLLNSLNEGPFYYPKESISDQSETTTMSEFIREKILIHTEEEVPHAVAVAIENLEYNEEYKTLDVSAIIYVERNSQKKILIGKNGDKLKTIGTEARIDINNKFNTKTHLTLWVKVKKDWRNQISDLNRFGYGNE